MHREGHFVARQTSTTGLPEKADGALQSTRDTIVFLVSLGSKGDQEIDDVITNMEFLRGKIHTSRNKDIVTVYPFPNSKIKTLMQLRDSEEQDGTEQAIVDSFSSQMPHAQEVGYEYKRCIVALIGHRHTTDSDDYFGAVNAEKLPALLGRLASIIEGSSLAKVSAIQFKLYCCNAQNKIAVLDGKIRDELAPFTKNGREVVLKATPNEVIGNPVYQNIAMGLDPKYNKHKSKYLSGRNISPEHQIPPDELLQLSHISSRVLARDIPKEFNRPKIKDRVQLLKNASYFKEKRNNWTTMTL